MAEFMRRHIYEGADAAVVINNTGRLVYSGSNKENQEKYLNEATDADFEKFAKRLPPKVSITATQGPLSVLTEERIDNQLEAGMSVARINCSHAEGITEMVSRLRAGEERAGKPLAIMLDTKGPEVRIMSLPRKDEQGDDFEISLEKGDQTVFTIEDVNYEDHIKGRDVSDMRIGVNYREFIQDVTVGQVIPIEGGLNGKVRVVSIDGSEVRVCAVDPVTITGKRHLNFPGKNVSQPTIGEKDKKDIEEGLIAGVDEIALSFARTKEDIKDLKDFIAEVQEKHRLPKKYISIIAKIENAEGAKNAEEILNASDGLMICRGDFASEMGQDKSAVWQRFSSKLSNNTGKTIILATETFESFYIKSGEGNSKMTGPESSDLFRMVGKYHPRIMLSGETGHPGIKNPEEAIRTVREICHKAEFYSWYIRNETRRVVCVEDVRSAHALWEDESNLARERALVYGGRKIGTDQFKNSVVLPKMLEIGHSENLDLLPEMRTLYVTEEVPAEIVDAITYQGRAMRVIRITQKENQARMTKLRNSVEHFAGKVDDVISDFGPKTNNTFGILSGATPETLKLEVYSKADHVFHSADIKTSGV